MPADDLGYPIIPDGFDWTDYDLDNAETIYRDNMPETTPHTASLETVEEQEARHTQARRDAALSYPGEYDYTDDLDNKREFPNNKELTPEPSPRLCPECNSLCSQGFIGTDDGETYSLWLCPNCGWNESETIPIDVVDFDVIDYVTWLGTSGSDREEPTK